ncbi:hypothetical protein RF11_12323 [Thelohanellus kitauei]|uniref:Uncharacterized protein n=1 Tax=Thelohanellus kitauei TaxID=669202 RepID=A0A0C2JEX9_THEKT|nr:hypothetical protein RF11_12323 [Thelohanellus kitauei]
MIRNLSRALDHIVVFMPVTVFFVQILLSYLEFLSSFFLDNIDDWVIFSRFISVSIIITLTLRGLLIFTGHYGTVQRYVKHNFSVIYYSTLVVSKLFIGVVMVIRNDRFEKLYGSMFILGGELFLFDVFISCCLTIDQVFFY